MNRRIPILVGGVLNGLFLFLTTYGHQVYPTLILLWVLMSFGGSVGEVAPLTNDYIAKESFGAANVLSTFVTFAASTIASSFTIYF